MKRLTSLILAFILVLSLVPSAFATEIYADSIARVSAIGIMGDVADADFRPDDNITRAEFATIVCRIIGLDGIATKSTKFTDVPSEHWASGYIDTANSLGLVNGKGDGIFDPEADVTFEEAAKILVCAVEYDEVMTDFTYPAAYISQASVLGITQGVSGDDGKLTRAEVAMLIDNTLDVKPIEPVYGSGDYQISSQTLYEKLLKINDANLFSGVLTQTPNITLTLGARLEKDTIVVDGRKFITEEDFDKYLGMRVNVYYEESTNTPKVIGLTPDGSSNKTFSVSVKDSTLTRSELKYYDENDKEKSLKIDAGAFFNYNGDPISSPLGLNVILGNYTLINNDFDSSYDVVLIDSAQSFIVESVNEANATLFFKDNKTYNGRDGFALDFDDEDKTYIIKNKDGQTLEFSDIKPGDAVSVVGNAGDTYVKLMVNNEIKSGKISQIGSDDDIWIGEESYYVGRDILGNLMFSPYLDLSGDFVIDAFGYCIGLASDIEDEFTYGYIVDAAVTQGMEASFIIKIVTGSEPTKEVKKVSGDETIYYHLQNDALKVFTLAEKVDYALNPLDARGTKMSASNILPQMVKGKIAGFTLNSEGKIDALNVYSVPANLSSHEFNASIFSFGGINVTRGFVKGDNTQVICVPNTYRVDDDYGLKVTLTDKSSYNVYGIKGRYVNERDTLEAYSEPVDIIIVKTEMDSSMPPSIPLDNSICIVGRISESTNSAGEEIYKAELLNGQNKEVYEVPEDSRAYSSMSAIQKGDLVQFVTNSLNEITAIRKLASVQGLDSYTDAENIYGVIDDVKYRMYDYYSNEMIDLVKVNVGSRIANIKIFKDEGQNVYLYDRRLGYIYPATTDDIKSALYYGDRATKIFALMEDNDAKVVVLITD